MKRFNDAYMQLPPKLRTRVKERITKDVFMVKNPQTFYNKKNGREKITEYEWNQISLVFQEYGIDIKTGRIIELCKTN